MEANGQKIIEYGSLALECALAVQSILELHILEMPGRHGKAMFRVRLEPSQEAGQPAGADEAVTLWACDGPGATQHPLFSGCLEEVRIREEGGCREAELTVLSGTVGLDRKKRDRVFQDASMGYRGLVKRILGDSEGSACILAVEAGGSGNPSSSTGRRTGSF